MSDKPEPCKLKFFGTTHTSAHGPAPRDLMRWRCTLNHEHELVPEGWVHLERLELRPVLQLQYRCGKTPWPVSKSKLQPASVVYSPHDWVSLPVYAPTTEKLWVEARRYFNFSKINYEFRAVHRDRSWSILAHDELNPHPAMKDR